MAVYNYKCPKCETVYEINKPMSESDREERCDTGVGFTDQCNTILVRDYMGSGSTFQLKGSGWTGKIKKT